MIIKKRELIENVIREIDMDDVLSGKHYDDVEDEVNATAKMEDIKADRIHQYRLALQQGVEFLEKDPQHVENFILVCDQKLGLKQMNLPNHSEFIKNFIASNDLLDWATQKIDDKHILNSLANIRYGELNSKKQKGMALITAVYIDLAYFLVVLADGGR